MKLIVCGAAVMVCACVAFVSAGQADPAAWLAQARAALGGAVAQEAVTSLTMRGSLRRHVGGRVIEFGWEASWEAPDKFIQVETQAGPMGAGPTVRRSGFNGARGIRQFTSALPMPPMPESDPDALVPRHRRELSRFLLALLASVPPVSALVPHTLVDTDPAHLQTPDAVVVTLEGPDQERLRLALDPVTRRPASVSWVDHQVVVFSTTSTVTVPGSGRMPPGQPPPPPMPMPARPPGVPPRVEYQMALTDYREDKGIAWPRRFTVTMGGEVWEEFRISGYTVNPKLNPRTFEVRR